VKDRHFAYDLLAWYEVNKRDLPWRHDVDPYRTWVSEVMLQQTRVDTVIPYYQRFITLFPTATALADAPEEKVLKAWEGLGYYSRARNLQVAVREVTERYDGQVPASFVAMTALKGVGSYTAGAVLSIAYNLPLPAVDGNVLRVFSRLFFITEEIAKPSVRRHVEELARSAIPEGRAADFNQAVMELGALVCTPRTPQCVACPLQDHCEALKRGRQADLPVKRAKTGPREEAFVVLLIKDEDRIAIRQRAAKGLLAGLWELPLVSVIDARADFADVSVAAGPGIGALLATEPKNWTDAGVYTHVFSHIHWTLRLFIADSESARDCRLPPDCLWADAAQRTPLTFGRIFQRILKEHAGVGYMSAREGGGQLDLFTD